MRLVYGYAAFFSFYVCRKMFGARIMEYRWYLGEMNRS